MQNSQRANRAGYHPSQTQVLYLEENSNKLLFIFIKHIILSQKTSVQDGQKRTYSVMQKVCQRNTPENLNPTFKLS